MKTKNNKTNKIKWLKKIHFIYNISETTELILEKKIR